MTDRVRRNGQLSSCEPCRKSKLRCDHNRPICGRCVRRRLSQQQCHYHPAPMALTPTPKQRTTQSERVSHQQLIPMSTVTSTTASSSHASPQTENSGLYEPINMSSNLMCFADRDSNSQRIFTSLTRTGVALPQASKLEPSRQMIAEGVQLLNDILDLIDELGEPLVQFRLEEAYLCIQGPIIQVAWNVTSKSMQSLLNDRSSIDLESISRAIFEQTACPPAFPASAAGGALESALSAQSLRWEMIGIYCAQIGVYLGGELDKLSSLTAHKKWTSDRKTLMQRAFRTSTKCESFCDQLGSINDLFLCFIMLNLLFASWCFGDDSYHVLRLIGSMTSIFFGMGFHRGARTDSSIPFYLVEIRKRLIAWAHDHDKVTASFTSRPPRLSRLFCIIELPLDLPDSAIMGTFENFLSACDRLDENGWSKEKQMCTASRQRVQLMLNILREEALELKFGPAVPDAKEKLESVVQRSKQNWHSIPEYMRYDPSHQRDNLNTTNSEHLISILCLRLDYLYTLFLLHTLLASSNEVHREKLIEIAHEIVSLVLLLTLKRELMYSNRAEIEWILVFYAMPCASVLVLELLRQDQHPEDQLPINRSGIIQDISVLISCCDSLTESGQSNYQICKQAQSIFSKSLDSILNRTEPIQQNKSNSREATVYQHENVDHDHERVSIPTEIPNAVQDPEWMAWLDSLGLQGDPWLESIIPTLEFPMIESM